MKKLLLSILFALTFVTYSVYGCTLKPNPLTDFDQSEYIFIGEVIGYTKTLEFKRDFEIPKEMDYYRKLKFKQANGLIVKVKETVYLPKNPKTHFEVFPFALDAGCGTLGIQQEELEKEYPKNSEILIIAKEAKKFPHVLPNGNFRLEVQQGRNSLITLNLNQDNQKITSIDSVFDYKKTAEKSLSNDVYFASKFEIRKDLLRLKNAKTQKDTQEILERIFYFHKSFYLIDFYSVFSRYISNPKEAEEFYRKQLLVNGYSEEAIQKEIERRQKSLNSQNPKKNS